MIIPVSEAVAGALALYKFRGSPEKSPSLAILLSRMEYYRERARFIIDAFACGFPLGNPLAEPARLNFSTNDERFGAPSSF